MARGGPKPWVVVRAEGRLLKEHQPTCASRRGDRCDCEPILGVRHVPVRMLKRPRTKRHR